MVVEKKMTEICIQRLIKLSIFLYLLTYVLIALNSVLINDDYMALYTMWLLHDGKEAYVDFNVDSYTLLFDMLAPMYGLIGERIEIVYAYRSIFIVLLCVVATQLYLLVRLFFTNRIAVITLLLVFTTTAMLMRGLDLRPDLLILVLWLQVIVILYISQFKAPLKMLLVGFLFACALLFKFKALLIGVVIGIYALHGFRKPNFSKKITIDLLAFLLGSSLCMFIFYFLVGNATFSLFLDTTKNLLFYSVSHSSESVSLRLRTIGLYFLQDVAFWVLVISGFFIAFNQRESLKYKQKSCLFSLFSLLSLSILANPHYHAYNLVTLYPLLAVFLAFSINWFASDRKLHRAVKIRLLTIIISIMIVKGGVVHYYRDNQHQLALNQFIQNNTQSQDAVFAYEGIGLFRPSTYHWRTSAINIRNYWEGRYNVWQEILSVKPLLIIESYRVPSWLLEADRRSIYEHYVEIAPYVLTLGFSNDFSSDGSILRTGLYQMISSEGQTCFLNKKLYASGEKFLLQAGQYSLATNHGYCTVQWYYPKGTLEELKQSNSSGRPYLYSP
ncbi:ArnT family glycosyltransferase [Vibrio splendidus]|uniref:ArnT family glycosyltransferase n=2 Tax=Vibrio splendidus TaxID=29497 RepID=UPI0021591D54|nr:glycosyltransferase family 39 protein [Vibrio splendidus]